MTNVDMFLDTLMSGNYFIIFLALMLIILVVLVLCLIKSREEYNELLNYRLKENYLETNEDKNKESKTKKVDIEEILEDNLKDDEIVFDEFDSLMALTEDDTIDENKPLIKQIDIPKLKTYNDVINEYELNEEECAVISAEELAQKAQARKDALGVSENRHIIEKYEEDQERKAIISYEQLVKNASNITLSYVEEEQKEPDFPKINKIEITQKEITQAESYLEEEEFLKILKEFRLSL